MMKMMSALIGDSTLKDTSISLREMSSTAIKGLEWSIIFVTWI